jgi:hypothetical protein
VRACVCVCVLLLGPTVIVVLEAVSVVEVSMSPFSDGVHVCRVVCFAVKGGRMRMLCGSMYVCIECLYIYIYIYIYIESA